jgi:hypothetical protein
MNLKTKALGAIAALGLTLTAAVPALAVSPPDDLDHDLDVSVTLNENGAFAVQIRQATLSNAGEVNALTGTTVGGTIWIQYTDTKSYRSGFYTRLSASDFESQTLDVPLTTNPYTIDSSNLTVVKNYNPAQGRWSSGAGIRIGDIGATINGNYTLPCSTPLDVPGAGNVGHQVWGSSDSNSLDSARTISCGHAGPGTAGTAVAQVTNNTLTFGTEQKLDVQLVVPAGQPADTYVSKLLVTVTAPGP